MLITKPHLTTRLNFWSPRYSSKYNEAGEWIVLIAKYKVHHASPDIIIEFTKAKHLMGQRFAIERNKAEKYPLETNGKIECYAIPMSALEVYDTPAEVLETVKGFGW